MSENELSLHLLPCQIQHDGPAPVSDFFRCEDCQNKQRAHFRGRELVGQKISLPTNVKGCICKKKSSSYDIVDRFHSINVWQHDIAPSYSQLQVYIDYLEVANAVSSVIIVCYSFWFTIIVA